MALAVYDLNRVWRIPVCDLRAVGQPSLEKRTSNARMVTSAKGQLATCRVLHACQFAVETSKKMRGPNQCGDDRDVWLERELL